MNINKAIKSCFVNVSVFAALASNVLTTASNASSGPEPRNYSDYHVLIVGPASYNNHETFASGNYPEELKGLQLDPQNVMNVPWEDPDEEKRNDWRPQGYNYSGGVLYYL
ncbi:MAG: hypothetical protein LBQ43_00060 [Holosporales bacterium]|jgi:hypothetical protein|nr:hypothetical protein [Holosporales bacterium]